MTSDGTMIGVLASVFGHYRRMRALRVRVRNLAASIALAERWYMLGAMKLTRVLISGPETTVVTGTQSQIDAAAHRMSRRNRACVTISVIVGHYHRRGCQARPSGGLETEGN